MVASSEATATEILQGLGLTAIQTRAFVALVRAGHAEARPLCEAADVPTSKIYEAMDQLAELGMVEIQPTRPRQFRARPIEQVVRALERRKEAEHTATMRTLPDLEQSLRHVGHLAPSHGVFWSVALGWEEHLTKHLPALATAEREIQVTLDFERVQAVEATLGPLVSVERAQPIHRALEIVRKHIETSAVPYRILVWPGKVHAAEVRGWIEALIGEVHPGRVRTAAAPVPSFYVIDRRSAIVVIPHPARPGRALASLALTDPAFARDCREAFEQLWTDGAEMFSEGPA